MKKARGTEHRAQGTGLRAQGAGCITGDRFLNPAG